MDEFDLIQKYFHQADHQFYSADHNIALGNGDDAAVFSIEPGQQIVSAMDTLLEGVHFPADVSAAEIAFKALAANLSDLAAMGATPHSFLLSLTLPKLDEAWLQEFSEALFALANSYQMVLIGGDTSRGPLSISIQVNGTLPADSFLSRKALQTGDLICVTGYLGLAALGLQQWQAKQKNKSSMSIQRFLRPEPRVAFASKLYQVGVRACVDISDGLLPDLKHMCVASGRGVQLMCEYLSVHKELEPLDKVEQLNLMLGGGDDYELCFGVSEENFQGVKLMAASHGLVLTVVGKCIEGDEVELLSMPDGFEYTQALGYKHFS